MSNEITAHYSFGGLRERIESGLAALDQKPTVELLGAVDEFHLGGRIATQHLVDQLGLGADDRVLDIGSGLGGLARVIASTTGASVTGVDLTAEYVEVATWLTDQVGLSDQVAFVHGTAADLPAADPTFPGSFTAATMLHVGMNIDDKTSAFAQVASRLPVGARFAIYDIMATGDEQPSFPCPWAATESTSFLETREAYEASLEMAGFEVEASSDRSDAAIAALAQLAAGAANGPAPLGLHLVMGPTTPTKVANMAAAVRGGVIAPTEVIARRV